MSHAYSLNGSGLNGAGTLIAIIVASDQPSIQSDLHNFDVAFGLPDPPTLNVYAPFGHLTNPPPDPSWPLEISLDVEWAHAVAPGASIAVVEAFTDLFEFPTPQVDLLGTVRWAVANLSPDIVSMSWSAPETTWEMIYGPDFENRFNPLFFPPTNGAGRPIAYVAADGDSGFETNYPAISTGVVGVGGTSLAPQAFGYPSFPAPHFDCSGASGFGVTQQNETVWGGQACMPSPPSCIGTGGGPSNFESKPTWQAGFGPGTFRLSPDVAMDADHNSGVALFHGGTWFPFRVGGTSLATPLWAGVVASLDEERHLRGQGALTQTSTANWIYGANANDFNDVITGSSPAFPGDPCLASNACVAAPGYDEVTGRGTPKFPTLLADSGVAGVGPGALKGNFVPLANPVRIMDTRTGTGGPMQPNQVVNLPIGGSNDVPTNAVAAVVNVGVTDVQGAPSGYVLVWPADQPRPLASTVNFSPGQTIAVLAQAQLSQVATSCPSACLSVYLNMAGSTGSANVFIDLAGYFTPTASFVGLYNPLSAPARALDTRTTLGGHNGQFGPGESFKLPVAGSFGIPAVAQSVVFNLTAVQGSQASYLSAFPAPTNPAAPCPPNLTTSNLNFSAGQVIANRVTVNLGGGGAVCLYNSAGNVDVLVDLAGWYSSGSGTDTAGARFAPFTPTRIHDSRLSTPLGPGLATCPGANRDVTIPPVANTAVGMNVTGLDATTPTYLQLFPAGQPPNPPTSDINFVPGVIQPNLVITRIGANHAITVCNSAGFTDFFIDLNGGYSS